MGGVDVCATPLEPSESGSDVADQEEEEVAAMGAEKREVVEKVRFASGAAQQASTFRSGWQVVGKGQRL